MECRLTVPHGTDISKITAEYSDIYIDDTDYEGDDIYFIGMKNEEGDEGEEWLSWDDAIEFCGFCEGAIAKAETLIEGNGGWAQGMYRREDFSGLAVDADTRKEYERRSNIWHKAFERGGAQGDEGGA